MTDTYAFEQRFLKESPVSFISISHVECLSIMHSSWIFNIDNEWIFVVIIKTGPDFGKRILRPQLFSRRPLKDPGFWILDSETFLVLQAPAL